MKKFLFSFLKFLIWFIVIIGILLLLLYSLTSDMCGNKVLDVKNDFQNNYKAILFVRDCGATTGFSKQISIISLEDELDNDSGNIFTSDNNYGKAKSDRFGAIVEMNWVDNKTLKVFYSKHTRIFKKELTLDDINIIYEESE